MQTTSIRSAGFPSSDMAMAALNALLSEVGQGQQVKITSMNVEEVDGVWVAVANIEMSDPEPEEEDDEEGGGKKGESDSRVEMEDEEIFINPYYTPMPAATESPQIIPEPQEVERENEIIMVEPDKDAPSKEAQQDDLLQPTQLSENTTEAAEQLLADFNQEKEPAAPVLVESPVTQDLRHTDIERMSETDLNALLREGEVLGPDGMIVGGVDSNAPAPTSD